MRKWNYLLIFVLLFTIVLNVNAEETVTTEKINSITLITYNDLGNGKGEKVRRTVVDEEAIGQFSTVFQNKKEKDTTGGIDSLWNSINEAPILCLNYDSEDICYTFKTNNVVSTTLAVGENSKIVHYEISDGNNFLEYVENIANEYADQMVKEEKFKASSTFDSILLSILTENGWEEKQITDTKEMEQVLKIINSNYIPYNTLGGLGGTNTPSLELVKNNEMISISLIGNNTFLAQDSLGNSTAYEMTYSNDSRASILEVFGIKNESSNNGNNSDDINSPETGDNMFVVVTLAIVMSAIALVAYRKKKNS